MRSSSERTRNMTLLVSTIGLIGVMAVPAVPSTTASPIRHPAAQSSPAASPATAPADAVEADLRRAIEEVLPPVAQRPIRRLASVRVDATGDTTVVFALREEATAEQTGNGAIRDAAAILGAVYTSPSSPQVRTTTLVGTFNVTGTRGARELRVMRVVLSAEGAVGLDWAVIARNPRQLAEIAQVYRLYPPFGDDAGDLGKVATPGATADDPARPPLASPVSVGEDQIISSTLDVGGRNLFLRCIGSGGPTVILEAGYGDDGTIWAPVQLPTSTFVRVCSYDRAGLMRSDPGESYPRTAADVVADLHTLLMAGEVAPPYLLVGHSYGALYSRLYAATFPDEVAGLLLVDPWHEEYDAKLAALVGPEQWTAFEALLATDPDYEAIDLPASYVQLAAAGSLPDVPLLVLSHGRSPDPACCPAGWPLAEQERLWQELQAATALLAPQGRRVVVPESGHMIHQEDPSAVVAALEGLVGGRE